ncbi:3-isopropylmalate dehydratase small subunit [bacterium]|nr:3-isopropylmalate dehydratase small subunit [bacterium]
MSAATKIHGSAWKYGDNVDTDVILPGRWCHLLKPEDIKGHCFEDLDPGFPDKVKVGDVVVAGDNFGCGSSREIAPLAIKSVGVSLVIAKSFARIFYRNCINIGLAIMVAPDAADAIAAGDVVEADLAAGTIELPSTGTGGPGGTESPRGRVFTSIPFPPFVRDIFNKGGLVESLRDHFKDGVYIGS